VPASECLELAASHVRQEELLSILLTRSSSFVGPTMRVYCIH